MQLLVYERAADLLEAELGDEIVALEPEGGHCFGFNAVAASVWRLLAEPRSFEALRDYLLAEFEVDGGECEAELAGLLERLTGEGLIHSRVQTCEDRDPRLESFG